MTFTNSMSHIADDTLELYSLQRVSEDAIPEIEEHLLVCHSCQDRLDETDHYILAMKQATAALQPQKPGMVQRFLESFRGYAQPVAGLSLAAALALFFIVRTPSTEMQTVELAATRSAAEASISSQKTPRLLLNAQGLASAPSYHVEVVDAGGSAVWTGVANLQNQNLAVNLKSPLSAGHYWIKVYGDSSRGNLLREYGLLSQSR